MMKLKSVTLQTDLHTDRQANLLSLELFSHLKTKIS